MNDFIYPEAPVNVDENVIIPQKQYRREVAKVIFSLLFFITVYLLLVLLSIGLAFGLAYIGFKIILFKAMFGTIMIGLGMAGLGVMVFYFLIKFIFTVKKVDRSHLYEISRKDFSSLFSFISRLAEETKAPMPKRIFLSPDVNASVFYDSSFLSMFFPVKKNLMIGLGFVNSVNLSEFKAVIAHEFGHFSQHSMKLGSYVYNVNKIIHNMLFDNEGYSKAIDKWAVTSGYFSLFAVLTLKTVKAIQWILKKVYVVVNISNLSLSRQMEHHADTVSAYVCGSGHLITALKRIEIADMCYEALIQKYDQWIPENIQPDNMFTQHREVIRLFAEENEIMMENDLPVIKEMNQDISLRRRIIVKDQWASHPGTIEREEYIKKIGIPQTGVINMSPWSLFGDSENIQRKITSLLFSKIRFEGKVQELSISAFRERYKNENNVLSLPKEYKGYYSSRRISKVDIENLTEPSPEYSSFERLFVPSNCTLPKELEQMNNDIFLLNSILSGQFKVKTFDFDGIKCTAKNIPGILKTLEEEKNSVQQKIEWLDTEVVKCLLHKCSEEEQEEIKKIYMKYYQVCSESDGNITNCNALMEKLAPAYRGKMSIETAREIIKEVKAEEKKILPDMRAIIDEVRQNAWIDSRQLEQIEKYLSRDWEYVNLNGYKNQELQMLNEAISIFLSMVFVRESRYGKDLLERQIKILMRN